jgi:tetratricopeptide (TPR) repeat protein
MLRFIGIAAVRAIVVVAVALVGLACGRRAPGPDARDPAAVQQGKTLLEQGQLDAALAKFEQDQGPDGLYHQGLVWAKKAESVAAFDEKLKLEDQNALALFEKAVAAKPDHAGAHQAIGDLLSPYTYKRHGPQAKKRPARAAATPSPSEGEPDLSPERVIGEYRKAIEHDKTGTAPVQGLIRLTRGLQRIDDAEAAFRELLARDNDRAEPHMAYGDFLAEDKKERLKAIEQYSVALVWKPDDPTAKAKIADLYLAWGEEHFARKEYASAQARFQDAQKNAPGADSAQARKAQEYLAKLAAIRGR